MPVRTLRVKESGAWCAPAIVDERFPDDGAAWAAAEAARLGFTAEDIEVVDADDDPRDGSQSEWVGYEPPASTPPSKRQTLVSELEAASTLAGLKAALLKFYGA